MTHIAFIGTGRIGGGLAEAALKRGEQVQVWNRTASKAQALVKLGAVVAERPGDAARGAKRVHITMTSDAAVDSVLDALRPDLSHHAVVVDHSTNAPAATAQRAERCEKDGIYYLHAPVFMSPNACRQAQGVMVVAGPRAAFEHVEEALETMTGTVWYLGEETSQATTMKLAGNAMIVSLVAGLSDAFAVASEGGIEPEQLLELFEHFDLRAVLRMRGGSMAKGDYTTHWAAKMARKDVGLMIDAASSSPLAILPAIAERLDALIERGDGDRDMGALSMDVVKPR
jgi:3-hydroxyisobutyrate dehydrogenase-like beta-hydroxyacid dehydrogenase